MGGSAALHFAIAYPEMTKALVVASTGSGSTSQQELRQEVKEIARRFETEDMAVVAEEYARGRARVQLLRKDPRGWEKFRDGLAGHSPLGSALTFRGVQLRRPRIFDIESQLRDLQMPVLIMCGDEDEPCISPPIFMKRNIPGSGLVMFPQTGHTLNLEEPDLFNRAALEFLTAVEGERWARRDVTQDVGFALR